MAGRPTKISPALTDFIISLIEGGVSRRRAFYAAGIHPSTGFDWMAKGAAEEDVDPDQHTLPQLRAIATNRNLDTKGLRSKAAVAQHINDHPTLYRDFSDRVHAGDSRFYAAGFAKMRETGGDDWRMWQQQLLMRFPELRLTTSAEDLPDAAEQAGSEADAQAMLDRAKTIRVKMLGTGTDG